MNRQNKKGYWFKDPLISFLKGFFRFEKTYRDARKFSIEIDRVGNNMFPLGEDEKYLVITHSDKVVEQDLNTYFISKFRRYRDRLYGDHFYMGNFFNDIMQQLVMDGEAFYAVDWADTSIEDRQYQLPDDFRYLSTTATYVKKDETGAIIGYKQRFSPLADLPPSYTGERQKRSFDFSKDEVFHTTYPMDHIPPVNKSMHLLKPILKFWDFGVQQSASWNPKYKELSIIRAGQLKYSDQKRKYALARAEVRKNFHYLLNYDDLTITEYYDLFILRQYKVDLDKARQYFIDQFNDQILATFAQKNNLDESPKLKLIGFMTTEEMEALFQKYDNHEITADEFSTEIKNRVL